MLILTRRPNEEVVVGDEEFIVKVLEVRGKQVRLGFTASKNVAIHRREIFDNIQKKEQENKTSDS